MSKLSLRRVVLCAMLAAVSILCGKYFAIPVGTVLRFSFENLPILLSGIICGPIFGLLTGITADLVGCVMVGYEINPLVTLGAAVIGFCGGILFRLLSRLPSACRVTLAVLLSHLLGSVLIKTYGLAAYYDMPFYLLLLWRLLNYIVIAGLEIFLLTQILKNKAIMSLVGGETHTEGRAE